MVPKRKLQLHLMSPVMEAGGEYKRVVTDAVKNGRKENDLSYKQDSQVKESHLLMK